MNGVALTNETAKFAYLHFRGVRNDRWVNGRHRINRYNCN